jgi:hypothetical protein
VIAVTQLATREQRRRGRYNVARPMAEHGNAELPISADAGRRSTAIEARATSSECGFGSP